MKFGVLCLALCWFSQAYSAEIPRQFQSHATGARAKLEYFKTDSNYLDDGTEEDVFQNRSFEHFLLTMESTYRFPSGFQLGGGARLARASSVGVTEDRTTTELTDVFAVGRYPFRWGKLLFTPEAEALLTLAAVDPQEDKAIASEGTNEFAAGAWLQFPVWRFRPYLYGGYRYRDDGRSGLAVWRAGSELMFRRFWLAGGVQGYNSVTDDEFTDQEIRRHLPAQNLNGGSLRYYSVNPDLVEAHLSAGALVMSGLSMEGGIKQTLSGKNTAAGMTMYLGFSVGFGSLGANRSRGGSDSGGFSTDTGSSGDLVPDGKFEPELENYDKKIFGE